MQPLALLILLGPLVSHSSATKADLCQGSLARVDLSVNSTSSHSLRRG